MPPNSPWPTTAVRRISWTPYVSGCSGRRTRRSSPPTWPRSTAADTGDWKATSGQELVRVLRVDSPGEQLAAVGYKRHDGELTWAMSMGFAGRRHVGFGARLVRGRPGGAATATGAQARRRADASGEARWRAHGLLPVRASRSISPPTTLNWPPSPDRPYFTRRLPVVYVSAQFIGRWAVDRSLPPPSQGWGTCWSATVPSP